MSRRDDPDAVVRSAQRRSAARSKEGVLELFGMGRSPGTRKCRWALAEGAFVVDLVEIDLMRGDQRKPEYLALNPNGTIPTLVHGDVVVWETNAIVTYAADVGGYGPTDARGRAIVAQWLSWEQGLHAALHPAWLARYRPGAPPDPEAPGRAAEAAKKALGVLDAALTGDWLAGAFGPADVAVGACAHQALESGVDLSPWPRVLAWLDRCAARPAFAEAHGRL